MPAMCNQGCICYSCRLRELYFYSTTYIEVLQIPGEINTFMASKSHKGEGKSDCGTVNLSIQEKGEVCSISLCYLCCPT